MKIVSKSSFTLFELLVVILIISIIYGIFIEKIGSKEHQIKKSDLGSIQRLFEGIDFNESASIVCIHKCKTCFLYVDGKKVSKISSWFQEEPKVYDFDIHGILSPVSFLPIFEEHNPQDVCFEYTLYPNKSHSSYIVEYQKRFYVFSAYMKPVQIVGSISQAQELYDPSQWVPTDSSEYNF